jgi:hypothetical protein
MWCSVMWGRIVRSVRGGERNAGHAASIANGACWHRTLASSSEASSPTLVVSMLMVMIPLFNHKGVDITIRAFLFC